MKKIIFSAIILFGLAVSAQTTSAKISVKSNSTVSKKSISLHKANSEKSSTKRTAKSTTQRKKIPDNRKEYMQKGQLATYTGHQATPINTDEFVGIKKKTVKKSKAKH